MPTTIGHLHQLFINAAALDSDEQSRSIKQLVLRISHMTWDVFSNLHTTMEEIVGLMNHMKFMFAEARRQVSMQSPDNEFNDSQVTSVH